MNDAAAAAHRRLDSAFIGGRGRGRGRGRRAGRPAGRNATTAGIEDTECTETNVSTTLEGEMQNDERRMQNEGEGPPSRRRDRSAEAGERSERKPGAATPRDAVHEMRLRRPQRAPVCARATPFMR